jgi:hypothetical protein
MIFCAPTVSSAAGEGQTGGRDRGGEGGGEGRGNKSLVFIKFNIICHCLERRRDEKNSETAAAG